MVLFLIPGLNCTEESWPREPIIGLSIIEFAAPLVLGLAVVAIRRVEWFKERMRQLTKLDSRVTSWDFAFSTQGPFFVRARLKSGDRIGGLFQGTRSFASAYPEPQDVFLEEAWRLDQDGLPVEPVPGSLGLLIRQDDAEVLEFLAVEAQDG